MLEDPKAMQCSHRAAEDDFFCEKYQIWYPMRDCNFRVLHRTFEGCVTCFQGRVNLRRLQPASTRNVANAYLKPGDVLSFPEPTPEPEPLTQTPQAAPPKR